jgi:hypothetical protein
VKVVKTVKVGNGESGEKNTSDTVKHIMLSFLDIIAKNFKGN